MGKHISEQFDTELEAVNRLFMEMGGMVEQQLRLASQALFHHDLALAEQVLSADDSVNRAELSIDNQCTHIIARRQPAASDLRLLISIMKASTDLERIGDEASRIAKMAVQVANLPQPADQYADTRHLATLVTQMVAGALDAMARLNVAAALDIVTADDAVDAAYAAILRQLADAMRDQPTKVEQHLHLLWAVRAMERIGDHAKNIAEYVIYLVKGKDVRHLPRERLLAERPT